MNWITTNAPNLALIAVSAVGIYAALLALTRLAGLRSFAKMSSFDFATTVAFGSIIATTLVTKDPPLLAAIFGLGMLYALQYTVARARHASRRFQHLIDNEPLVLMAGEHILHDHLAAARVTEDDLRSKLRLAGITDRSEVFAVVFETTGDCSVIRRDAPIDGWLFTGVRGAEHLSFDSR